MDHFADRRQLQRKPRLQRPSQRRHHHVRQSPTSVSTGIRIAYTPLLSCPIRFYRAQRSFAAKTISATEDERNEAKNERRGWHKIGDKRNLRQVS